jgi:hypothetical protein
MGVPRVQGGSAVSSGPSGSKGHSQFDVKRSDVPRSGRCGDIVYYMLGNKQCQRRYVVPKDPRTPKQLRCRAVFGEASRTWSHSPKLTQEDRRRCCAEAAKVQSRVRLGQSGPLTGQQHYVGRTCAHPQPDPEPLARPRPLSILHSAFFLHHSLSLSPPRPTSSVTTVQPRYCPHVGPRCFERRNRSQIRPSQPEFRSPAPEIRRPTHPRPRWRGS